MRAAADVVIGVREPALEEDLAMVFLPFSEAVRCHQNWQRIGQYSLEINQSAAPMVKKIWEMQWLDLTN